MEIFAGCLANTNPQRIETQAVVSRRRALRKKLDNCCSRRTSLRQRAASGRFTALCYKHAIRGVDVSTRNFAIARRGSKSGSTHVARTNIRIKRTRGAPRLFFCCRETHVRVKAIGSLCDREGWDMPDPVPEPVHSNCIGCTDAKTCR
jgi:hypothetical protein